MIFGFDIEKQPPSKKRIGVSLLVAQVFKWLTYISFFGGLTSVMYKVYLDFWVLNNKTNLDIELVLFKLIGAAALVLIVAVFIYIPIGYLIIRPLNKYLQCLYPMIGEDYIDLVEIAKRREKIKEYIDEVTRLDLKREITRGEFKMMQKIDDGRQIAEAFEQIYSGDV